MVHPPKVEAFTNILNNLGYEELKELEKNEQYLKDFIFERDEIIKFD
jgi:hypothetical protein